MPDDRLAEGDAVEADDRYADGGLACYHNGHRHPWEPGEYCPPERVAVTEVTGISPNEGDRA